MKKQSLLVEYHSVLDAGKTFWCLDGRFDDFRPADGEDYVVVGIAPPPARNVVGVTPVPPTPAPVDAPIEPAPPVLDEGKTLMNILHSLIL